jgi:triosephosphate isomerase
MRRKIVAGNWKMNGNAAFTQDYLEKFKMLLAENNLLECAEIDIVLAVPPILLPALKQGVSGSAVAVSGQNVSSFQGGAYTGEVSAEMLADMSCQWCLVGHSERRALFGETDQVIVEKVRQLLAVSIKPILCVGETLEQRDAGQAEKVVAEQLDAVFGVLSEADLEKLVVAYEPVWAIGTGQTASPEQAQSMHAFIRARIAGESPVLADNLAILYGGSVNSKNADALFGQADIDGGLVGGASLKPEEFILICNEMA